MQFPGWCEQLIQKKVRTVIRHSFQRILDINGIDGTISQENAILFSLRIYQQRIEDLVLKRIITKNVYSEPRKISEITDAESIESELLLLLARFVVRDLFQEHENFLQDVSRYITAEKYNMKYKGDARIRLIHEHWISSIWQNVNVLDRQKFLQEMEKFRRVKVKPIKLDYQYASPIYGQFADVHLPTPTLLKCHQHSYLDISRGRDEKWMKDKVKRNIPRMDYESLLKKETIWSVGKIEAKKFDETFKLISILKGTFFVVGHELILTAKHNVRGAIDSVWKRAAFVMAEEISKKFNFEKETGMQGVLRDNLRKILEQWKESGRPFKSTKDLFDLEFRNPDSKLQLKKLDDIAKHINNIVKNKDWSNTGIEEKLVYVLSLASSKEKTFDVLDLIRTSCQQSNLLTVKFSLMSNPLSLDATDICFTESLLSKDLVLLRIPHSEVCKIHKDGHQLSPLPMIKSGSNMATERINVIGFPKSRDNNFSVEHNIKLLAKDEIETNAQKYLFWCGEELEQPPNEKHAKKLLTCVPSDFKMHHPIVIFTNLNLDPHGEKEHLPFLLLRHNLEDVETEIPHIQWNSHPDVLHLFPSKKKNTNCGQELDVVDNIDGPQELAVVYSTCPTEQTAQHKLFTCIKDIRVHALNDNTEKKYELLDMEKHLADQDILLIRKESHPGLSSEERTVYTNAHKSMLQQYTHNKLYKRELVHEAVKKLEYCCHVNSCKMCKVTHQTHVHSSDLSVGHGMSGAPCLYFNTDDLHPTPCALAVYLGQVPKFRYKRMIKTVDAQIFGTKMVKTDALLHNPREANISVKQHVSESTSCSEKISFLME